MRPPRSTKTYCRPSRAVEDHTEPTREERQEARRTAAAELKHLHRCIRSLRSQGWLVHEIARLHGMAAWEIEAILDSGRPPRLPGSADYAKRPRKPQRGRRLGPCNPASKPPSVAATALSGSKPTQQPS